MQGRLVVVSTLLVAIVSGPASVRGDVLKEEGEFQLNTYTTFFQFGRPGNAVARTPDGFVVVWHQYDGGDYGIQAGRFDSSGALLGTDFQVNTYTTGAQYRPAVSAAADGSFVVVWTTDYDGSDYGIRARRFDAAGVPQGTEFEVNTDTAEVQDYASVGTAADGSFVVVWQSYAVPAADQEVRARRFDLSGMPLGSEFQVNTTTTYGQYRPDVSVAPNGSFVVVWNGYTSQDYEIFARRFSSSGTPLGGEFQLNSHTTGNQYRPAISMAGDGSFVVVWTSTTPPPGPEPREVTGRRFEADGTPIGSEFQVSSITTGFEYGPDVAINLNGSFLVVWDQSGHDGSLSAVVARRYGTDGAPDGADFQINTYTTGFQDRPSVASDGAGRYVAVWTSPGDGSGTGMFAQRLCTDANVDGQCDPPSTALPTLTVTKTADTNDGACNADCSLREAVIAANSLAGIQEIDLGAGTYELTLGGFHEDSSATGDLDINDRLRLTGAGAAVTVIDANGLDRVLDIHSSSVVIRGVTLRDGAAPDDGGGIRIASGITGIVVEDSIITANSAQQGGGGIFDGADRLTVLRTAVSGNQALGTEGGGIWVTGNATIERSTISGNSAPVGGGIANDGVLVLSRSTVSGNMTTAVTGIGGGGIYISSGPAFIVNSTISGNTTDDHGGGICNSGAPGDLELFATTIVDNTSTNDGGGLGCSGVDNAFVANTVIGRNTPDNCPSGSVVDSGGFSGAVGHNVDDDGTCGLANTGDQSNVPDVGLGPLADNGGGTLTHAVLPGSPLVGSADSTTCGVVTEAFVADTLVTFDGAHDQIGFLRDVACDVGAVELGASCGGDNDADGVCNLDDNCPNTFNPDQRDSDGTGGGDVCDLCPSDASNTCKLARSGAGVIDSGGGSVASADGLVEVSVAPGTFAEPTSVSITGSDEPNFGLAGAGHTVTVVKLEPEGIAFAAPVTVRFAWLDEESNASACPDGNGAEDVSGADETQLKVWRNGVAITTACSVAACEAGSVCSSASCDECANEYLVDVTEFSEYVLELPAAPTCSPAPSCVVTTAAQAKLDYNEKKPGREKMKLQWKKLADATTQSAFGDPVAGSTGVSFCIYDDADALVEQISVNRAGQLCAGTDCWKAKGSSGYGYKDKEGSANGVSKIGFKSGSPGKGKADAKGANNSAKGQTALPTGVVAQLTGNVAPTIEMVTSDGFCVAATMSEVKKDEAGRYAAQLK